MTNYLREDYKLRNFAVAVAALILLSGCSGFQLGNESEMRSAPTASEAEFCRSVTEAPAYLSPSRGPGEGFTQARVHWALMASVAVILDQEGSSLNPLIPSFIRQYGDLISAVYSNQGPYAAVSTVNRLLPQAAEQSAEIVQWCAENGVELAEGGIDGGLGQIYPTGAWERVEVSWGGLVFVTRSLNNRLDFSPDPLVSEAEISWAGDQTFLQVACNTDTNILVVFLTKYDRFRNPLDFGPPGGVRFLYGFDDAELTEAQGFFEDGLFLPFATGSSEQERNRSANEAFSELLNQGESIRLVLDAPGGEVDAVFYVNRSLVLTEALGPAGCFDF